MNWPYALIMLAAWATGFALLLLGRQPLGVSRRNLAAGGGRVLRRHDRGQAPFRALRLAGLLSGQAWFQDGKTIMSGLVGGYWGAISRNGPWAFRASRATCWPRRWRRHRRRPAGRAFMPAAATATRLRFPGASISATAARGTPRSSTNRLSTSRRWRALLFAAAADVPRAVDPPLFRRLLHLSLLHGIHPARTAHLFRPDRLPDGGTRVGSVLRLVVLSRRAAENLWPWRHALRKYRDTPAGDHLLKPTRALPRYA